MKAKPCPEFEEDEYIEGLIKLRESKPAAYYSYPQAVRDVIEDYEREKRDAQRKMPD